MIILMKSMESKEQKQKRFLKILTAIVKPIEFEEPGKQYSYERSAVLYETTLKKYRDSYTAIPEEIFEKYAELRAVYAKVKKGEGELSRFDIREIVDAIKLIDELKSLKSSSSIDYDYINVDELEEVQGKFAQQVNSLVMGESRKKIDSAVRDISAIEIQRHSLEEAEGTLRADLIELRTKTEEELLQSPDFLTSQSLIARYNQKTLEKIENYTKLLSQIRNEEFQRYLEHIKTVYGKKTKELLNGISLCGSNREHIDQLVDILLKEFQEELTRAIRKKEALLRSDYARYDSDLQEMLNKIIELQLPKGPILRAIGMSSILPTSTYETATINPGEPKIPDITIPRPDIPPKIVRGKMLCLTAMLSRTDDYKKQHSLLGVYGKGLVPQCDLEQTEDSAYKTLEAQTKLLAFLGVESIKLIGKSYCCDGTMQSIEFKDIQKLAEEVLTLEQQGLLGNLEEFLENTDAALQKHQAETNMPQTTMVTAVQDFNAGGIIRVYTNSVGGISPYHTVLSLVDAKTRGNINILIRCDGNTIKLFEKDDKAKDWTEIKEQERIEHFRSQFVLEKTHIIENSMRIETITKIKEGPAPILEDCQKGHQDHDLVKGKYTAENSRAPAPISYFTNFLNAKQYAARETKVKISVDKLQPGRVSEKELQENLSLARSSEETALKVYVSGVSLRSPLVRVAAGA